MNAALEDGSGRPELMSRLPALLRTLGAAALVVAMYSFLVQGWQSGNDVARYLMMLGHTGLLAVIGIASGHWLKEGKGARLLLALALVSVPANFAILGAFILSQTPASDWMQYPHYVAWSVDSLPTALLTTAAASLVLIPVTLFAFRVLARGMSSRLSLLFLLSNLALLFPVRDPQFIAPVVALLTAGVVILSKRAAHNQVSAQTREGVIALGLQLLPLGVLLGRTLWLYSMDLFLVTVLAASGFVLLRQLSFQFPADARSRKVLDFLSLFPALAMGPQLAVLMDGIRYVSDGMVIPLAGLASAALVYDIAQRGGVVKAGYRRLSLFILLASLVGNLFLFPGFGAAFSCAAAGIALMIHGYRHKQLSIFSAGLVSTVCGLVYQFADLLQHFDLGSWASLAMLGVVAIVSASVLESRGARLRAQLGAWWTELRGWER